MIICPKCKEEIEERSYYCDQCGQALMYCDQCGRVGLGRRCTSCGGLMVSPNDIGKTSRTSQSSGINGIYPSRILKLSNTSLNIFIDGFDGAVIGRRQGPYMKFFQNNMYVSGVHAQLHFKADTGWYIVDKHSSNGTKLNNRPLQPDVEIMLNDGDVLMIANINLKVSIN